MYSNNRIEIGKAICHLQRALSFGVQGTVNCDGSNVDSGLPQIDDKYIPSNSRSDLWFFTWSEYPDDWAEKLHVICAPYRTTVEVKCNWGAIPQETPQGRKFLVGFVEYKKTKHRFLAPVLPWDHENLVYKNGKGIFFGYSVGKKTTPRPPQCTHSSNGGLPGMLMFLTKHGTEGARYSIGLPFQHIMYTDGNKRRIGWGDCKDHAKIRWGYVAPKGHTYVVPYDSNGGFFESIKGNGDWRERPILVNNGDIEELIEVYLKPKAKRKKGNLSTKPNKSKRKRSRPTPEMLEDTGTQHGAADTRTAQGASEHVDPFFKQVSIDNDDLFNLELRSVKDWPSGLDSLSDSTDFTETQTPQTPQTPQNLDTSKETTHAPGDLDEILKYLKELEDVNS